MTDKLRLDGGGVVNAQFEAGHVRVLDPNLMAKSWDANYFIWQRNLQGAPNGLNEEIRRIAETRQGEKPFRILEITGGIPLKAIDLAGKSFRRYGDMLEYDTAKHAVPKFSTTVVSPDDYLLKFLQRKADDTNGHLVEMLKLVCAAFNPSLLELLTYDRNAALRNAQDLYQKERASGRMNFIQSDYADLVSVVDGLVEKGNRYDLVFLDTEGIIDLPTFLHSVQRVLAEGGIAYVPLEWWSPTWEGGVNKRILIDRSVIEQLIEDDPKHFLISNFPGASTLIIKGSEVAAHEETEQPINDSSTFEFYGTLEELQDLRQIKEAEKLKYEKKIEETRARIMHLEKLEETQPSSQIRLELINAKADLDSCQYFLDTANRSIATLAQKRPVSL